MSHDDQHQSDKGPTFEPGSAEKGFQFRLVYIALLATLGGSAVFGALLWPALQGLVDFERRAEGELPGIEDIVEEDLRPPGPLLQPNPPADMELLRQRDRLRRNSYGWVDENAGVAHIPVALARELVLRDQLPTATGAPDEFPEGAWLSETAP